MSGAAPAPDGPGRPPPAIVVLAAGASSRMRGEDKLLRPVEGTPLLLRAVRAACAVARDVAVVLPRGHPRRAWLGDAPARIVEVDDRAMSASIAAGVAACPPGAVSVHLADMPEIGAAEHATLASAWSRGTATILRAAAADGRPGHPVVFDASLRDALMGLRGDAGARDLMRAHEVETVRLPGMRALVDLDTPEAWAAWEAARRAGRAHVRS